MTRWLQCPKCNWRSEPDTAMRPFCPECGERLHIHREDDNPAPILKDNDK